MIVWQVKHFDVTRPKQIANFQIESNQETQKRLNYVWALMIIKTLENRTKGE